MDQKEFYPEHTPKRSIKEMEEEIKKENKIGLLLQENLKLGDGLDVLNDFLVLMKIKKPEQFKPEDIVFYSEELGILRFNFKSEEIGDFWSKAMNRIFSSITTYSWADEKKQNELVARYYPGVMDNEFDIVSIKKNGVEDK